MTSRAKNLLERLSELKEIGIPIVVIAEELSIEDKKALFEEYGVRIWDVTNLLWLFEEYPDIKNEFVAFLEDSTDHIRPEKPDIEILQKQTESKTSELDSKSVY